MYTIIVLIEREKNMIFLFRILVFCNTNINNDTILYNEVFFCVVMSFFVVLICYVQENLQRIVSHKKHKKTLKPYNPPKIKGPRQNEPIKKIYFVRLSEL